jgi:hypothetical protein
MSGWVDVEFASLDLGDARRDRRAHEVIRGMWEAPQASTAAAAGGWKESRAAYRLWDCPEVTPEAILRAHQDQIKERIQGHRVILHIQDTSELDFSKKKTLKGTGPLSETSRQGFFIHNEYLLTSEGLPMGVWHANIYARSLEEHGQSRERKSQPLDQKESFRWLQAYHRACEMAELLPKSRVISIADRESDIYEYFEEYFQRKQDGRTAANWIIRSNQDRRIQQENEGAARLLHAAVEAAPVLGTTSLAIKAKEQLKKVKGNRHRSFRCARQATLEIRACQVTLAPPARPGNQKLSAVSVWVVMAKELHPPPGEDPIEWILLTNLNVRTIKKALRILQLYSQRWQIEVFFKILKSGCQVEQNQLRDSERLLPRVAVQMVIAWRIHFLTILGRECPDLPCGVIFEKWEWKPVVLLFQGPSHEEDEPSLSQMIGWIGRLGGHLGRKSDGPPGPAAIWKGLDRVHDFALLWIALHHPAAPTIT